MSTASIDPASASSTANAAGGTRADGGGTSAAIPQTIRLLDTIDRTEFAGAPLQAGGAAPATPGIPRRLLQQQPVVARSEAVVTTLDAGAVTPDLTVASLMQSDANGDGMLDPGELLAALSAADGGKDVSSTLSEAQYIVAAYRSKGVAGVTADQLATMLSDEAIKNFDGVGWLSNPLAPAVNKAMGRALASEGSGGILGIRSPEELKAALQARGFTVDISDDDLHALFVAYGGFFKAIPDILMQAMLDNGALALSPWSMSAQVLSDDPPIRNGIIDIMAKVINQFGTYASSEASPPMSAAELRKGLDAAGYATTALTDQQLQFLIAAYSGNQNGVVTAEQLAAMIKDGVLVLSNDTAAIDSGALTLNAGEPLTNALAASLAAKGGASGTIADWQTLKKALTDSGFTLDASDDQLHLLFTAYAGADGQLDAADLTRMLTDGNQSLALSPDMTATASVPTATIGAGIAWMAQVQGAPLNWGTLKSALQSLGYATDKLTDQQWQYLAAAYAGNPDGTLTAAQIDAMIADQSLVLNGTQAIINTSTPGLVNALAASIAAHGATPGTIANVADLKQALVANGFADVHISDGLLQRLIDAYGTKGALGATELAKMMTDGALTLGLDRVVTADPDAPAVLAAIAAAIFRPNANGGMVASATAVNAAQLNDGLEAAGFNRLSDAQAALLVAAYGTNGWLDADQANAMLHDGAIALTQGGAAGAWNVASLGRTEKLSEALAGLIAGSAPNGMVDRETLKAGLAAYGYTASPIYLGNGNRTTAEPTDADFDALIAAYADAGKTTLSVGQLSRMLDELGYDLSGKTGRGPTVRFDSNRPVVDSVTVTPAGVTIKGKTEDGAYSASLTGGVWSQNRATTYAGFQPVIAHPESLPQAIEYAKQLAAGKTVQQLFPDGSTPEQRAILQDAYELLGISNRQIAAYAKAAVDGHIGYSDATQAAQDAMAMLRVAGRMRGAADNIGKSWLIRLNETFAYKNFPFDQPNDAIDARGMIGAIYAATGDKDLTSRLVLGSGLSGHVSSGFYNSVAIFPGNPFFGHLLDTSYDSSLKDGRDQWGRVGVTSSGAAVDAVTRTNRFLLGSLPPGAAYAVGGPDAPALDAANQYAFTVGGPYEMVNGDLGTGKAPTVTDIAADGTAGASRTLNVKVTPNAVYIDGQKITDFGFGTMTGKDGKAFAAMVVHAGGKTYVFDAAQSKELITDIGTELFPDTEMSDLYGLPSSVDPKQSVIQAALAKVVADYSGRDPATLTPAQRSFLDHVRIAGLLANGGQFASYRDLSKETIADIFDADKNNRALQQDMLDPEVAKDITAATRQVLPAGEGQKALDTMRSAGFANFVSFLGTNVSQDAANRAQASLLQVVATVAPDQVDDAQARLLQNVYQQGLLALGSSADAAASSDLFAKDLATLIAQDQASFNAQMIRIFRQTDRGTGQIISTLNHFWVNEKGPGIDPEKTIFGTLLAIDKAFSGQDLGGAIGDALGVVDANIDANPNLNAAERSAGKRFVAALSKGGNDTGIFGTIAGLLALGSGIYKASDPNFTATTTGEKRLSIANDFLIFASVPSSYENFAKFLGGLTSKEAQAAVQAVQEVEMGRADSVASFFSAHSEIWEDAQQDFDLEQVEAAAEEIQQGVNAAVADVPAAARAAEAGSIARGLWAMYQNPQFVGLIDTSTGIIGGVLSGYQLARGIEKRDAFNIAGGAIGLAGGAAGTAAGIAEIAGFSAVSTGLFALGNVFGVAGAGLAIGAVVGAVHKARDDEITDSREFLSRNADVLKPGGEDTFDELLRELYRETPL